MYLCVRVLAYFARRFYLSSRDDFKKHTRDVLAKRAAYICSNPDCKKMTVAPSTELADGVLYVGRAAHITSAARGGPRFDASLPPEQRSDISNGIFLCANCADMIDDNNGADFKTLLLHQWKVDHEAWVSSNLNKGLNMSYEAVDMLRQMSGGQSAIHLCCRGNGLFIKCEGNLPLRDLELKVKDETNFSEKIKFIEETNGNGMSADQAFSFLAEATVFHRFFPVLDFQAKSAVSSLHVTVPALAPSEERHYSYRATALNGLYTGAVFIFRSSDGSIMHVYYGYANDRLIIEHPENYPKIVDSQKPDWARFDCSR